MRPAPYQILFRHDVTDGIVFLIFVNELVTPGLQRLDANDDLGKLAQENMAARKREGDGVLLGLMVYDGRDPAHVVTAATLRHDYQHPTPPGSTDEGLVRDLADYDRAFGLGEVSQP